MISGNKILLTIALFVAAFVMLQILPNAYVSMLVAQDQDSEACPCASETISTTASISDTVIPRWSNNSSKLPNSLQRVAVVGEMGGGGDIRCDGVLLPRNNRVWIVANGGNVEINHPTYPNQSVIAEYCGPDNSSTSQIYLISSNNNAINITQYFNGANLLYPVRDGTAPGDYILSIRNQNENFDFPIKIRRYSGPLMTIRDAQTNLEVQNGVPGQELELVYNNFAPSYGLETRVYKVVNRTVEGFAVTELVLADAWLTEIGETGDAQDHLTVPLRVEEGLYTIATCYFGCEPAASGLEGPVEFYSNVAYQVQFSVENESLSDTQREEDVALELGKVAFVAGDLGETSIYVINFGDSIKNELVVSGGNDKAEPDWSPDGNFIVYQSNISGNYDIEKITVDSGEIEQLTSSVEDEREPDWSPNGETIVFRRGGEANEDGEFWIMDEEGQNQRRLDGKRILGRAPVWSPSGEQIAFMSQRSGSWQIYAYDLQNGTTTQLTDLSRDHARFPNWSPDGEYLIYSDTRSLSSYAPEAIWRVRADGSAQPEIVVSGGDPGRPVWSNSGSIIFNGGEAGLEIMGADGSNRHRIPNTFEGFAPDVFEQANLP